MYYVQSTVEDFLIEEGTWYVYFRFLVSLVRPDNLMIYFQEFSICTKLIQLAKDLSLTNQEYFLSFIEGDSLITRRIAQWVAYSMLSGEYGIQLVCIQYLCYRYNCTHFYVQASKQSKAVPELVDILGLLKISISSNSQEQSRPSLFELRRNPDIESDTDTNSDADYSILSQRITLLSYVLMNIPQFDKVDNGSGSSLLDMIVKELEKIQNNIGKLLILGYVFNL